MLGEVYFFPLSPYLKKQQPPQQKIKEAVVIMHLLLTL